MENKYALSAKEVCYAYEKGTDILRNISVSFKKGRMTALLGANGCGKSTLLNLLAGTIKPDDGTVYINGSDIRNMKRMTLARQLAVVHQNNTAPSDITVKKLVMAGRTPYKRFFQTAGEEDEEIVEQALRDTHMEALKDRAVSALSGGQMQRVWLAMALAQNTGILLLDEITTYLDIHYQMELLHLIRELNKKKNLTLVMVLHDINLAMEFCDEVVVMKHGEVLAQGDMDTAVDEKILNTAFEVSSKIMRLDGRKYCIFSRKGGAYV